MSGGWTSPDGSGQKIGSQNRRAVIHELAVSKLPGHCRHHHRPIHPAGVHLYCDEDKINIFPQMASIGCRSIGWLRTERRGRSESGARRETLAVGKQKVENQIAVNTIHASFKTDKTGCVAGKGLAGLLQFVSRFRMTTIFFLFQTVPSKNLLKVHLINYGNELVIPSTELRPPLLLMKNLRVFSFRQSSI